MMNRRLTMRRRAFDKRYQELQTRINVLIGLTTLLIVWSSWLTFFGEF